MYAVGTDTSRDFSKAYMGFTIAAKNGNAGARKFRDRIATRLTPQQIAKAQKRADAWKPTP